LENERTVWMGKDFEEKDGVVKHWSGQEGTPRFLERFLRILADMVRKGFWREGGQCHPAEIPVIPLERIPSRPKGGPGE